MWQAAPLQGDTRLDSVRVEVDHSHGRAYPLPESGVLVFVEPELDLHSGQCLLRVRSAVTIHNHSAILASGARQRGGRVRFSDSFFPTSVEPIRALFWQDFSGEPPEAFCKPKI